MTDQALRRLALRTLLASFPGHSLPGWARELLHDGLAGYVLFGYNIAVGRDGSGGSGPPGARADTQQLGGLVSQIRAARPDAIVGIDEEGGDVTRLAHAEGSCYPGNAALGVVDDPSLTLRVYRAIGAELRALGINLNLAPTVDVNTSDDNPIIGTRSFGVDPQLVARHAAAAVAGLQETGVAACAKHFPGHGATVVDSHAELPTVDEPLSLLRERELPPFAAAVEAGALAVMTAHIRVPELTGEVPATLSEAALTGLLRGELGFGGAIVTDALEMRGASAAVGIPEAAVRALAAGADLLCIGARVDAPLVEATAAAIADAARDGRLAVHRLEEAAARAAGLAARAAPDSAPREPGREDTTRDRAAVGRGSGPATLENGAGIGLTAARRALRVEGDLPKLRKPLLVQIDSPATIAAGELPWGIARYLVNGSGAYDTGAELVRLAPGDDTSKLVATAGDRQILVVSRDTHRHRYARGLVEQLAARSPEVVLVEMGWPAAWRPAGLRAYVATYGASQANARAAAEALIAG
ncbi:MAG: glycoside hydrolase family 3 protein [Micromonosporaceae bacterium]|nr:glycoside hydrolase family 3 protein [Micromonosporaceae bacterium]